MESFLLLLLLLLLLCSSAFPSFLFVWVGEIKINCACDFAGGVLALCAVNTDWLSSRDTLCHLCTCSIESDWGHHVPQRMQARMGIFWLYTRKNLINWLLRTSFVCCKLIIWTAKLSLLLSKITGSWYYIIAWHFTRGCMSKKKKKKFV